MRNGIETELKIIGADGGDEMDYREELKNITMADIFYVKNKKLSKEFRNKFCNKLKNKCFIGEDEDCAGIWKCAFWSTFLYNQLQEKDKVIEAVREYKKAREEYQDWQPIKKIIEPLQNVLNIYDRYKEIIC